jgi:hypothetical protein
MNSASKHARVKVLGAALNLNKIYKKKYFGQDIKLK